MPNSALNNRPLHCSNLSNNFPSINLLPTNFSVILIITESILTRRWSRGRRVSDCCSWDGVECDNNTSQVIGLDLSCSWLNGTIHPNTTIFYYFPHLQSLNLAFNDFVPIEVSFLSKLVSLDLSSNYGLRLEEPGFELLVQNLTKWVWIAWKIT
ncbi:receptor-like protein Cf-9 isoform X2 [Camellia sinensis]|uniref:receptor-like protein Cf-9 isoform X2 n=1 Tax=Camellia sinensis TaxID=4442 RepID=UPI001036A5C6|nr:receptor-like protein Cf-9 isoform X2 [Camellia sinensis]